MTMLAECCAGNRGEPSQKGKEMSSSRVLCETSGGVGRITLNRPEAANALDLESTQELYEAAVAVAADGEIRAVLLEARGSMFCAGGDLKRFHAMGERPPELGAEILRMTTYLHGAIAHFNRMSAPVVCKVQGTAAGGGLSLAMSCDLVVAARSAKFSLAYTAAGLAPDGSSTYFLPRLVGLRRARELMLTNRRFDAEEALAMNVIDRVCDDDRLDEEAGKLVEHFAAGPTAAYGAVKRLLLASTAATLESQMDAESREIARAARSTDGIEGVAAFVKKRRPAFTGG